MIVKLLFWWKTCSEFEGRREQIEKSSLWSEMLAEFNAMYFWKIRKFFEKEGYQ